MGKNKLKKFAEMETFSNVFQCGAREMLPSNQVHPMAGHWREQFFHNDHPIVLELGCGRGEYTVGLAKKYPCSLPHPALVRKSAMLTSVTEMELSS